MQTYFNLLDDYYHQQFSLLGDRVAKLNISNTLKVSITKNLETLKNTMLNPVIGEKYQPFSNTKSIMQ